MRAQQNECVDKKINILRNVTSDAHIDSSSLKLRVTLWDFAAGRVYIDIQWLGNSSYYIRITI